MRDSSKIWRRKIMALREPFSRFAQAFWPLLIGACLWDLLSSYVLFTDVWRAVNFALLFGAACSWEIHDRMDRDTGLQKRRSLSSLSHFAVGLLSYGASWFFQPGQLTTHWHALGVLAYRFLHMGPAQTGVMFWQLPDLIRDIAATVGIVVLGYSCIFWPRKESSDAERYFSTTLQILGFGVAFAAAVGIGITAHDLEGLLHMSWNRSMLVAFATVIEFSLVALLFFPRTIKRSFPWWPRLLFHTGALLLMAQWWLNLFGSMGEQGVSASIDGPQRGVDPLLNGCVLSRRSRPSWGFLRRL